MGSDSENQPLHLHRLRIFDAVASTGTMRAAADLLHITQPAVTRALQALEDAFRAKLMERRRAGSFPTPEGLILARRARRFFQHLDAALADAIDAEARGAVVGRLARKIGDVHIRSLIAIGKAGSFRRAAKALGIAEPTLHRPARDLERLMKISLFRRTPEGIGLSATGAELARQFALAGVEITTASEELAAHRGAAGTTITIGVLPLAPKRQLATVTEKLLRTRRPSRIVIEEASYDELVVALRSGAIDLIFGALRAPPPFADLSEENLFEDPYGIVCRKGHPLTRLSRPTIDDLRHYAWVFPTANLPRRAVLDAMIAAWNLSQRAQIETNSVGALIADLAASDHLSLLPRAYVAADGHTGTLAVLALTVPHRPRIVGLTARRGWLPTQFQSDFIALLREAEIGEHAARRRSRVLADRL
jgi:LysR family transcriptional regulator, regulator for genes of the gallate degradation pathway